MPLLIPPSLKLPVVSMYCLLRNTVRSEKKEEYIYASYLSHIRVNSSTDSDSNSLLTTLPCALADKTTLTNGAIPTLMQSLTNPMINNCGCKYRKISLFRTPGCPDFFLATYQFYLVFDILSKVGP